MVGDLEGKLTCHKGKLTCHKWNGSSTVDYGIVQNSLRKAIDFFKFLTYWGIYQIIVLFH